MRELSPTVIIVGKRERAREYSRRAKYEYESERHVAPLGTEVVR